MDQTQPTKKRINVRQKGARAERQWRDVLREHGFEAKRGVQFAQGKDALTAPDVECSSLPFVHFEVKAVQSINLHNVMSQQAEKDARHKMPVIAHKRDNDQWLVALRAADFMALLKNADLETLAQIFSPLP